MGLNDHFLDNLYDENLKNFLNDAKLDSLLDNDPSKKAVYDFDDSHGGFSQVRLLKN